MFRILKQPVAASKSTPTLFGIPLLAQNAKSAAHCYLIRIIKIQ